MSDILFDPNPSQASEAFQRACQHAADRLPEHVDHAAKLLPDLHEIYARALKLFTIAQLRFWHVDSSDEEDNPRPLFPSSGPCPSWTLDHPGPAPPALALANPLVSGRVQVRSWSKSARFLTCSLSDAGGARFWKVLAF